MRYEAITGLRVSSGLHAALLSSRGHRLGHLNPTAACSLEAGHDRDRPELCLAGRRHGGSGSGLHPVAGPRAAGDPTDGRPQTGRCTARRASREALLVQADAPKLPAELEACDCDAHEHGLPNAARSPSEAKPAAAPELPPLTRRPAEAAFSVTTEVSLPASPTIAGSEVDVQPRKLATNLPPPYPPQAYARGQQGRLLLEVHVTAAGTVESLRVIESSGVPLLDESASETVARWRFEPAQRAVAPRRQSSTCQSASRSAVITGCVTADG